MIYVFLLGIAAIGCGIYLSIMFTAVPGALDERLGVFEQLPENIGDWYADTTSPEAKTAAGKGLRCEVRFLLKPASGLFSREALIKQVRLRDTTSSEIVEILPEVSIKRKRKQA